MLRTLQWLLIIFVASFSVLTAFWIIKTSQAKERSKEKQRREAKRKWRKQRTATTVFLCTFGALSEVHFLHAIYHFKAQEVKNPTLQTVYDLELKWGRYGLRKTTAPCMCEFRTTNHACANFSPAHDFFCIFYLNSFLIPVISESQALLL